MGDDKMYGNDRIVETLRRANEEVIAHRAQASGLQNTIRARDAEIASLKGQLTAAQMQVSAAADDRDHAASLAEQRLRTIADRDKALADSKKVLNAEQNSNRAAVGQIASLTSALEARDAEIARLRQSVDVLQAALHKGDDLQEQIGKLKDETVAQRREIDHTRQGNIDLREKVGLSLRVPAGQRSAVAVVAAAERLSRLATLVQDRAYLCDEFARVIATALDRPGGAPAGYAPPSRRAAREVCDLLLASLLNG